MKCKNCDEVPEYKVTYDISALIVNAKDFSLAKNAMKFEGEFCRSCFSEVEEQFANFLSVFGCGYEKV